MHVKPVIFLPSDIDECTTKTDNCDVNACALTLQDPIFVHANLVTPGMESLAMVIIKT